MWLNEIEARLKSEQCRLAITPWTAFGATLNLAGSCLYFFMFACWLSLFLDIVYVIFCILVFIAVTWHVPPLSVF